MHEGLRLRAHALLYIVDAFVQDLPDHPADAMSDGPYGRLIAEPGQQSTEDGLEWVPAMLLSAIKHSLPGVGRILPSAIGEVDFPNLVACKVENLQVEVARKV